MIEEIEKARETKRIKCPAYNCDELIEVEICFLCHQLMTVVGSDFRCEGCKLISPIHQGHPIYSRRSTSNIMLDVRLKTLEELEKIEDQKGTHTSA